MPTGRSPSMTISDFTRMSACIRCLAAMAVLPLEIVSDGGAIWSRTRTCPDIAYLLQFLHPAASLAASLRRLANVPPLLSTPDGTQMVCHRGQTGGGAGRHRRGSGRGRLTTECTESTETSEG